MKNTIRVLFLALIVSLGWMQPFFFTAGQRLTPADLIFCILVILWIISLLSGRLKFKWHKFYWVLGGYFSAMLIASVFSVDPKASFIKLIAVAYLIGLCVLAFNLVNDKKELRWVALAWLGGAMVPVLIALVSILLFYLQPEHPLLTYTTYHYGAVPVGNYPRISSTFISASMFCNYLNVCLVMLFIARRAGWVGKTSFRIFLAAIQVCSVFTISAGLGGIFLSTGIWLWFTLRHWKPVRAHLALESGLAVAAVFFALNLIALQNSPDARGSFEPSSRVLVWSDALKTFSEDPLTGKGLGQAVSSVVYQNTDGSYSLLTDAHNIFLSIAAQAGVIGLAAFLLLTGYVLRLGMGVNFAENRDAYLASGLGLAFLSAFVYQGLTGSFEDARHLWVLIGLIPACRIVSKNRPSMLNSETYSYSRA